MAKVYVIYHAVIYVTIQQCVMTWMVWCSISEVSKFSKARIS